MIALNVVLCRYHIKKALIIQQSTTAKTNKWPEPGTAKRLALLELELPAQSSVALGSQGILVASITVAKDGSSSGQQSDANFVRIELNNRFLVCHGICLRWPFTDQFDWD